MEVKDKEEVSSDFYLVLMELHKKLEENMTSIIADKLKILQVGITAIQELAKEEYVQFIHDTANKIPVNHTTFNEIMHIIEVILGNEKYWGTFQVAREITKSKLQNRNLTGYEGTPEWTQSYPRILKSEFLSSLLAQGNEFKEQIQYIEDFEMFMPGGKEKIIEKRIKNKHIHHDKKKKKKSNHAKSEKPDL